jgi:hypothetical protein
VLSVGLSVQVGFVHLTSQTNHVCSIFVVRRLRHTFTAEFVNTIFMDSIRNHQGEQTALRVNEFGTLTDLVLNDGTDMAVLNSVRIESIVLVSTGESIVRIPHNLNLIPQGAINAMYALMGLEWFILIILAFWVNINRHRKLIRNSSPNFMMQVLFGAAVMVSTIIPLSFQDDQLVPRAMTKALLAKPNPKLNMACMAEPILFSLGFFICFSALFLKAWRLIRIFNNSKLKNLFLKDRQLFLYQLLIVVVVIVLNAIWAGIDPLVWQRQAVFLNAQGLVVESNGLCYSRSGIGPALPLVTAIMLVLLVGNYLAYLGRRIPTEFNESKWTAMTMIVTMESFAIGVPVLVLANNVPVAGYLIKCLIVLLVAGAVVGLIFGPKVAIAYNYFVDDKDSNPWRFVRNSDSSNNKKHSDSQKQVVNSGQVAPGGSMMSNNHVTTIKQSGGETAHYLSKEQSTAQALQTILADDPLRRKFRRYLKTLKMEENVRFWDAALLFKSEKQGFKRYVQARAIVQTFVMDKSPFQVNLSSALKESMVLCMTKNNREEMENPSFFDEATKELFEDLRKSDAFRQYLEGDTFSLASLHNLTGD